MKKKKLSLESIFNEADILQHNQELKFAVVQKLPQYFQMFMKQLKTDQYQEAVKSLSHLISTAQETQQQLMDSMQKNPAAGTNKQGQMPQAQKISDEEL